MKLLIDENLSPDWVNLLRAGGFEAEHWSAMGSGDASDAEIMAYAANHGYVVLTQDLDFGIALARLQTTSPSVVQLRGRDMNPDVIAAQVISAMQQISSDLAHGVLLTIDARNVWRIRATVLPIQSKR